MLRACSCCGRLHEYGVACPHKIIQRTKESSGAAVEDLTARIRRFRNSQSWQRCRAQVRQRDKGLCRCCFFRHHRLTTGALSVHHITSLEKDFDRRLDMDNLITLCHACHEDAEAGLVSPQELRMMIRRRIEL
jgi:5-methylcytosine-specific restriction protein A